jgi:hypothetical protein
MSIHQGKMKKGDCAGVAGKAAGIRQGGMACTQHKKRFITDCCDVSQKTGKR